MVGLTQVFTLVQCLRCLYGPDFKFASRLTICVESQSHQFLCNASGGVWKVYVASQACDGFMQQGPVDFEDFAAFVILQNKTIFHQSIVSISMSSL